MTQFSYPTQSPPQKILQEALGLFWNFGRSDEKFWVSGLVGGIILFNLLFSWLLILLNEWSGRFYTALQELNSVAFIHQLYEFCWLVACVILVFLAKFFMTSYLAIRWDRWMTKRYLREWLTEKRYYRLSFLDPHTVDNPDQRISEDIPAFVSMTLSLGEGLLSAGFTLVFFSILLWTLSESVAFFGLYIPGFLFWVACLYAGCGTFLTLKIGKPLIGLNFKREVVHGNFRYALVRLRENAESVALSGGEAHEEKEFLVRYGAIIKNAFSFLHQNMKLNLWLNFYSNAETIVPALVMAPGFFAGRFKLGIFMQVTSAFNQVHTSLSFIVQSYMTIAQWQAVTQRLVTFERQFKLSTSPLHLPGPSTSVTSICGDSHLRIVPNPDELISADFKELRLPQGTCLIKNIKVTVASGEWVLIQGPSGVGKSTLLKALCGLWPFGEGEVRRPPGTFLVLGQRPYLPLGTLKDLICYPSQTSYKDQDVKERLQEVGLGSLIPLLHKTQDWHHSLSLGEQQRLNFARLLLQRPKWIIMDESTSGLDETSESTLLRLLQDKLPRSGVMSVGHRSTLKIFHNRLISLGPNPRVL